MKTAQQASANWTGAMGSAQTKQKYIDGINGYSGNPMADAATPQAMQAYADGVQRSIDNGKRLKSLQNASPTLWKSNATSIGASNLQSGAKKGAPKYQTNIAPYAAVWPQMRAAARALPKGGLQNATNRVNAALSIIMGVAGTA